MLEHVGAPRTGYKVSYFLQSLMYILFLGGYSWVLLSFNVNLEKLHKPVFDLIDSLFQEWLWENSYSETFAIPLDLKLQGCNLVTGV